MRIDLVKRLYNFGVSVMSGSVHISRSLDGNTTTLSIICPECEKEFKKELLYYMRDAISVSVECPECNSPIFVSLVYGFVIVPHSDKMS